MRGVTGLGLLVIMALVYLPIFYRIHKRLDNLEKEVERLRNERKLIKRCVYYVWNNCFI